MAADTWFILASGPSMDKEQAEAVRGKGKIIAINNTVNLAPFADYLYSIDPVWWRTYDTSWFKGVKLCSHPDARKLGCVEVFAKENDGLGLTVVHRQHSSGGEAINFAFLIAAKRMVLLGFDNQHTNGKRHWHPNHPRGMGNFGVPNLVKKKLDLLSNDLKKHKIEVINCSKETSLTCFRRAKLSEVI